MEHFYVTLPSDSCSYYFPSNTIANFKAKLDTPSYNLTNGRLVYSRILILKGTKTFSAQFTSFRFSGN